MTNVYGAAHVHAHGGVGGRGGEQVQVQGQQQGDSPFCFFHPRDLVVGVCAHCLRDRLLLLLASKHAGGRARSPTGGGGASYLSSRPYYRALRRRTGSISLPKVFALGSSFLQRLDSSRRHHRPDDAASNSGADDTASVASLDDSFISIKFEDNGKATWDSSHKDTEAGGDAARKPDDKAAPADTLRRPASSTTTVVVVDQHAKRGGVTRWRKQVLGRLLQLARWKRSAGAAADQRSKGRGGRSWIRSLTTRRRAAAHGERAWS